MARISQSFTVAIIVVIHFYLLFGFISMSLNLTFNLLKDIDLKVSKLMLIQIGRDGCIYNLDYPNPGIIYKEQKWHIFIHCCSKMWDR